VAITAAFAPAIDVLSTFATAVVIGYGGYLVLAGTLTVGLLTAFLIYVQQFFRPIQLASQVYTQAQAALAGAERIYNILDEEPEPPDPPEAQKLEAVAGRISFEDVTFAYEPGRPVLHDVSFEVEPGQTVALVGPTGAGKTTIANLIPRFYDVTGGSVRLDEHDVRDVTLASLRGQIGVVMQSSLLFSGSVRDNIAYGKPNATREEIEAAARAAQADGFVRALPQGYDTVVGERGLGLSGGQRQRIAIARALLIDPRLLILDDSTSAVDAETEAAIQESLDGLMRESHRTVFVIAQRISTVRDADLILVLDGGGIAAIGTHDELLSTSELYNEILGSQILTEPLAAGGTLELPSADGEG
jgi:ATP-binding cassette subfamily B multidrug efflux pump